MLELNEIYLGDCLEVMKEIDDKSIDMILCDLPYGTTQNKWDTIIPLNNLWYNYNRIIKDNGCIALTAQTPFDKILGYSNIKNLKYEWIWQKEQGTGFLNSRIMPLKEHENILIFGLNKIIYNPIMKGNETRIVKRGITTSSNYNDYNLPNKSEYKGKYPTTIIKFPKDRTKLHPTQKPVSLFEYLIKTYTNPGMVVLDNCIGSGTTAIACLNTARQYIGIEKDEGYFKIAQERIKKWYIS